MILKRKLATVKSLKADVSSVSSFSAPLVHRSEEGLTLETAVFKLLTVANLRFQLSW